MRRAAIGLTRNPFEVWDPDRCRRWATLDVRLLAALQGSRPVIQIVAASGMGKTTALLALAEEARRQGYASRYLRVERGTRALLPPDRGWWLLDEAQFAPRETLLTACTAAVAGGCRIFLGSHRDRRGDLRHVGLPAATVRLRGLRTDAAVAVLAARYLEAAGASPQRFPVHSAALHRLRKVSGGNVEVVLRLCYEIFEDLDRPRGITLGDVRLAEARLRVDAPGVFEWRRRERLHRG